MKQAKLPGSQNNYLSKREVYLTGDIGHLLQMSQNNYLSKREVYTNCIHSAELRAAASQNNYLSKREVYTKVSTSRSKIQRVVSLKITTSQRERFISIEMREWPQKPLVSQNNYLSKREVYYDYHWISR